VQIKDSFRMARPLDETWTTLLDIERIAPCLPGATLDRSEGTEHHGSVRVKVGPISAQYQGTATLSDVDQAARRITIRAAGRDARGQGNARATIVAAMHPDGNGTRVDIETDLDVTGKVAQFGRGILGDVSTKLLRQFVDNLERDIVARGDADDSGRRIESSEFNAHGQVTAPSRESEPVDLLALGGNFVGKRLVAAGAIAGVILLVAWAARRRRHPWRS
jgi:carbon monoxide dehydrogenase subunit G